MRTTTRMLSAAIILAAAAALSAAPQTPVADVGEGRVAWFDITTKDMARAKDFYGKLFGWEFATIPGGGAVEIQVGGRSIGNLRTADGQISPFDGVVYIQVKDIQASCDKAKELGGTVPPGFPFNLPDGSGSVGLAVDPSGHPIGMFSRTLLPKARK